MLSLDANLLFYAFNLACPEHPKAAQYLAGLKHREDVALSEFILCEFYVLMRNPAIVSKPLSGEEAAGVVSEYRVHPCWKIVGFPPASRSLHDTLWECAADANFARRRIFDARTAFTLLAFGVKEFATANVKDYQNLGFERVWNPCTPDGEANPA